MNSSILYSAPVEVKATAALKALVKAKSKPGLWLQDIPDPVAGINDVLIKIRNAGIVVGLNLKINLCMGKSYGYRSFELLQLSLYHTLGDLPEPKFTHRFC